VLFTAFELHLVKSSLDAFGHEARKLPRRHYRANFLSEYGVAL
jgi:hypothetical protein